MRSLHHVPRAEDAQLVACAFAVRPAEVERPSTETAQRRRPIVRRRDGASADRLPDRVLAGMGLRWRGARAFTRLGNSAGSVV
jgi:hypothetical protein